MPTDAPVEIPAPPKRGRPKKQKAIKDITITPVRQVCQWCRTEVMAGQEPRIWTTCAKCQAIENAYEAETPCPSCGGRKTKSVAGVLLKDGHRDNCITRAVPVGPQRRD